VGDVKVRTARLSLTDLALGISNCRPATEVVEAVVQAHGMGIGSAFIAEDIGCRDAFQLTALSTVVAPEMSLTVGVTNPYLRSPVALAQGLITLNELAAGPVSLGLGSSSEDIISGQLGHPYPSAVPTMREAVDGIRKVWAATARSRPRIVLAAMGPRMLRLAGEIADGVILNTGTTPSYVEWAIKRLAEGAARSARDTRTVSVAVWLPIYMTRDGSVSPRARQWAASMLSIPRQGELLLEHAALDASFLPALRSLHGAYPAKGDVAAAAEVVPEEVVKTLALTGTVEDVIKRLPAYVEAGTDVLIVGPRSVRLLAASIVAG
jgi:5,10-methylenetetrahydromethanopterin reductase